MKKILLVYPHNFLERNMGQNNRTYEIMSYLHSKGFIIDLFAFNNFFSDFTQFDKFNHEKIVRQLYLYDYRKIRIRRIIDRVLLLTKKIIPLKKATLNWVTKSMRRQFNKLIKNEYDYIVMVYSYTAELLNNKKINSKKINFVEDFLSIAHYVNGYSNHLGNLFESEIKLTKYFDDLIYISNDEKQLFEKLLPDKKHHFLPHFLYSKKYENCIKDVDVLFVGHDNPYNIKGIQWFFSEIYPLIDEKTRIVIAGKVSSHVPVNNKNINLMGFVDDLDVLYKRTKIIICPLLNGTGMKIKVIEALSYGIPVVCTSRGVDGFADKTKNGCLVTDDPAMFANHINSLNDDEILYTKKSNEVSNYFNEHFSFVKNTSILNRLFNIG